jgi:hypothetical protein
MAAMSYNRRILEELSEDQVDNVNEILLGVASQYYKRLMGTGRPYVRKA